MPAAGNVEDTPLLRQYKTLKASYPHAILFFRLGDFYEMFGEDARVASPILGVVLTKRQDIPMCGVPHHSFSQYVSKLLKAGHKVAIADQMEDPSQAKGIVKRAVTRLITPGTLVEDELLNGAMTNYLVAIELEAMGWGLACAEVSTGEFWATQTLNDPGHVQLYSLLSKLDPAEVIASSRATQSLKLRQTLPVRTAISISEDLRPAGNTEVPKAWENQELWSNRNLAFKAALRARTYIAETQSHLKEMLVPAYHESSNTLQLDEAAVSALELVRSEEGGKRNSLWGILDRTCTPMGSRRLRSWILHPLIEPEKIERRAHCVEELAEMSASRARLNEILRDIADIERVISRMATRSASPRDLAALRDSLFKVHALSAWVAECAFHSGLLSLATGLKELSGPLLEAHAYLDRALAQRPSIRISDGGFIREGFNSRLDELRSIKNNSRAILAQLEERERKSTGIPSLKAGYNSIFGYYLEVTKVHQSKIPGTYIRRQTLTNAERYITPELKELEAAILGADEKSLRLEAALFETIRSEVLNRSDIIRRFADLVSEFDVLNSLAEVASLNGYAKPVVDLSCALEVSEGRHPIVEAALPAGTFVPNSLHLDGANPQTVVLTGPNMGGKSVFLRQNALIVVMAQMGSFVPAKSARIGLVDKILTRIGARDRLARGESTFMVEMRETSHILKTATRRSLILLDEVGRGTSTYDGISIAWAILEHLNKSGPRVIFATHYFELTRMAELLPGVRNANVEAREWTTPEGRTEVIFLHRISPGPADRSFGIHVAELAGIPAECLARAREILQGLEGGAPEKKPALPLSMEHPMLDELKLLNPDQLTPLEALKKISEWKKKL